MAKTVIIPHRLTWRDDDIGEATDLQEFCRADQHFTDAGIHHTLAVITDGLVRNRALVNYINGRMHLDPQLHCHTHQEYSTLSSDELAQDIERGIYWIGELFRVRPTILYPPWNKSSKTLEAVAAEFNLRVHAEKLSLNAYLRVRGHVKEDTINFHYWNHEDQKRIPMAIAVYREMGWDKL